MSAMLHHAPVSICVLTYGDFPDLAARCIDSILRHCDPSLYRLIVGANAVGCRTRTYLEGLHAAGAIHDLIVSPANLYKCPMMRRMFQRAGGEFILWMDDDSHLCEDGMIERWLSTAKAAAPTIAQWGQLMYCEHEDAFWNGDAQAFVRSASWYEGLTPPSWAPGGKGELDFANSGGGNGIWQFVLGAAWLARTAPLKQLDWPDPRLRNMGEDVFLGEAIRQKGWEICEIDLRGLVLNDAGRRWPVNPPISDVTATVNQQQHN